MHIQKFKTLLYLMLSIALISSTKAEKDYTFTDSNDTQTDDQEGIEKLLKAMEKFQKNQSSDRSNDMPYEWNLDNNEYYIDVNVNGQVCYGCKLKLAIPKSECDAVLTTIVFYSKKNNELVNELIGKSIPVKINDEIIDAKVSTVGQFMYGHQIWLEIGWHWIDSHHAIFDQLYYVDAEIMTSNNSDLNFNVTDYFDQSINRWIVDGYPVAITAGREMCLEDAILNNTGSMENEDY